MSRRLWGILAIVVAVAVGAGVGIGAALWAGGGGESTVLSESAAPSAGSAAMDERAFLASMVPHHEDAVAMASLALERSRRPQIRRLAREIIRAQNAEVAMMQSWYSEWYGEEIVGAGHEEGMPGMDHGPVETGSETMDLGRLEDATGDEFDLEFLTMMIPHHAGAIVMADAAMAGAGRGLVTMLAGDVIATQSAEIGRMQRWRDEWFPQG